MTGPKPGSKYASLYDHLRRRTEPGVELSLNQIEALTGAPLPGSARSSAAFWSNRRGGLQASAWLEAGYRVSRVDLARQRIRFERRSAGRRRRKPGPRWDAEAVRALREHMDLNQGEMAEILGVRQQTISEWETGVYAPTRGRSKHLDLVAERAGFPYKSSK
jgi:DNA-binding transcriptional regulator YiaG